MTDFLKKSELKNNWVLINAENAVVGRLAAFISIAGIKQLNDSLMNRLAWRFFFTEIIGLGI